MKNFTRILLLLNLVTLAYLIGGARMELPPVEEAFRDASSTVSKFQPMSPEQEIIVSTLMAQIEKAKRWSNIVVDEYRRPELPLFSLTLLNMFGLFLNNRRRKAEPSGAVNDLSAVHVDRH